MAGTGGKGERTWSGLWGAIRTAWATAPEGCPTCPGPDAGLTIPEARTACDIWSLPIGTPGYRR